MLSMEELREVFEEMRIGKVVNTMTVKETLNHSDLGYLKGRERCESPYDRQFDSATEIVIYCRRDRPERRRGDHGLG